MTTTTSSPADAPGEGTDDPGALERAGDALVAKLLEIIDDGVGPFEGARDYAESRLRTHKTPEDAIRRIVREVTVEAGGVGFVTGLGGIVTTLAALPINISAQAVLNARMVAAIAYLRGWDISDEAVKISILVAIAGGSPNAVLREFGIKVGQGVAKTAIKRIPIEAIRAINKKVGFMLLAKYGTKRGAVALVRLVPVAGGVVGGTFDAAFVRTVAVLAKKAFPAVDSADSDSIYVAPDLDHRP